MNNNKYINKKRNILVTISKLMIILILPLTVLLTAIQIYGFNKDFYNNQYEKNQVSNESKISSENLDRITKVLIDYLKDDRDNLDIQTEIDGGIEEVFGEREKLHMEDVKGLFNKGFLIRNYGIVLILLCGITIYFISSNPQKHIFSSFYFSSIFSFSIMLLLFIMIKLDFMKYFTYFHKIFFDNDLWLLNPRTDVLIQMLPLEFFINISISISILFTSIMLAIFIVSVLKLRKLNNRY